MKGAYLSVALSLLVLGLVCTIVLGNPSMAEGDYDDSNEFTIDYGDYGLIYEKSYGNLVSVVGYTGTPVHVDIPGEVEYDGVTYMVSEMVDVFVKCTTLETFRGGYGQDWFDLNAFAFYECTSLRTIEFGPYLRFIHDYALLELTSLESFSMPEGSNWNTFYVDDGVLMANGNSVVNGTGIYKYPCNKSATEYIVPDNINIILARAFDYAFNLEKVVIHKDVKRIDAGAFHGCVALKVFEIDENNMDYDVLDGVLYEEGLVNLLCYPAGNPAKVFDMPDSVVDIMDQAFFGSVHLEEVIFSSNLLFVGFEAFNGSKSLEKVVLPEGTVVIGENCFTLSPRLESVSFPSTMVSFGSYLFRGCTSLSVVYNASDVSLGSLHFVESTRTFYYYKDAAHTIPHDDPKEMYGDIYLLQSLPVESEDHIMPITVGIVVAVVLSVLAFVRFKN